MPCNAIATQTAKVNLDVSPVIDNPQAITAVQQLLATLLGIPASAITIYNEVHGWGDGWQQWRHNGQAFQTIPVERLAGSQYIDWVCEQCCIRLHRSGKVEIRDGWNLGAAKKLNADTTLAQVHQALAQVTGLLFQRQVKLAVAKQAQVIAEQRAPNGALVLTVNL